MKNILFVDDDPMVLRGIERSLSDLSDEWTMRFATGGAAALEILATDPCDVVVTDMRMPGMNGATLLNEVMQRHPGIARIVLSGQADQKLVLQAVATSHQYLSKPCEPAVLVRAIRRMLELQSALHSESVRALVGRLNRLPSCPALYRQINAVLACPDANLDEIGSIVEKDIAMTAKLLKIVNSAFFGLCHRVDSAAEAVNYLGVDVLKSLILTVHFFDCGRNLEQAGLDATLLWSQAVLTATAAKTLARLESLPRPFQENAFTAGMLHNCGLLVLAENLPQGLARIIAAARAEGAPLDRFEREIYGATHAEIGGYLLGLWGLPASIVESVILHASGVVEGPAKPFGTLTLVHVAQALVGEQIKPIAGVPASPLNLAWISELGLTDRLPIWREAVAEVITGSS
jgi:HD-like signal output (HDOD) protein/CheY-like chemotaxis protein